MARFIEFPSRKLALGIAVISVLAVGAAVAFGLQGQVNRLFARTAGAVGGAIRQAIGADRRQAA